MLTALALWSTQAAAQRYPFYNLSIENGLIQSQATSLAQDASGHLWIGTLGGLSRYDGHSFTSYTVRDGLPANDINALHTDRQNRLWIGTSKGISRFDGRTFTHFSFASGEDGAANLVTAIETTPDGTAFCISGGRVWRIQGSTVKPLSLPGGYTQVSALHVVAPGDVFMALRGAGALYHVHDGVTDSVVFPEKEMRARSLYEDRQHTLWLLTNKGLYQMQSGIISPTRIRGATLTGMPSIFSMAQAPDNSYWLGTATGTAHLTDSIIRYYNKRNGFTDNLIYHTLADSEGNIWLASDGQGIFRFSGAPFTALDESMGLPSAQVMGIAAGSDSSVYLGTYDAGLYFFKGGKISPVPYPAGITPTIVTMATTRAGRELWIGTRNDGLWKYDGTFRHLDGKSWPLPSSAVTVLHPEGDTALWIGCVNGGALYSHNSFRLLPLKSTTVFDFLRLGTDSMLLATPDGLKLYDGATIRPFTTGTITDSVAPECLARQGNMLWIGTSDDGVIGYDRATRRSLVINKRAGLHSEFIYNLFLDNRGVLWAGTGFGIHSIRLKNGAPIVTFYGREQGVTGMESNHNAVLGMADGSIWFGTTNGALHYQPAAPTSVSRPPGIVMQSIQLFGEPITDTSYFSGVTALYGVPQHLRLPYLKNNLTFSFHAISLTGDEDIQYRYRMDGLEAGWSDWSATSSINYSSLPPGKYTLYIQCTTDGATPVRELAYPFEIITPFHKTLLFSVLLFALCILLGVTLQYIINRRKAARLRLIEALRREEQRKVRQRTAEDFHDEVGNKLTRINVLTNVLRGKLGAVTPDAERIIGQIQDNTGQLYSGTRDILWALDPNSDNLYQILCRIRDFGNDLFGDTDITFRFSGTDEQWKIFRLPMDASRNLIMIFKEALNNCLKYADATEVALDAHLEEGRLYLSLHDNGKGFDPETVKRGHGIDNMQVRTGRLNGRFKIASAPGNGSTLQLTFKIPQNTV